MDSSAVAAWVAFLIALFALVVALAQAVQQYVATAQVMRKCDKSVWGPMPGRSGKRVWSWHQMRFRVIFDMPNIFLPSEYWETSVISRVYSDDRIEPLPSSLSDFGEKQDIESAYRECSEACWVSFTRQVSHICPNAAQLGLTLGDADRWPSDLAVVPMQVSLRDIIVLGLMIGMTITDVSNKGYYLEMNGPSGCIVTAQHPLLGTLLHFSAFPKARRIVQKGLRRGDLSRSWLGRLRGVATVAKRAYGLEQRCYYEQIDGDWRWAASHPEALHPRIEDGKASDKPIVVEFEDMRGQKHELPPKECDTWKKMIDVLDQQNIAKLPYIVIGPENKAVQPNGWNKLVRVIQQGNLQVVFKIKQGDYIGSRARDDVITNAAKEDASEAAAAAQARSVAQPDSRDPFVEPAGPSKPSAAIVEPVEELPRTPDSPSPKLPPTTDISDLQEKWDLEQAHALKMALGSGQINETPPKRAVEALPTSREGEDARLGRNVNPDRDFNHSAEANVNSRENFTREEKTSLRNNTISVDSLSDSSSLSAEWPSGSDAGHSGVSLPSARPDNHGALVRLNYHENPRNATVEDADEDWQIPRSRQNITVATPSRRYSGSEVSARSSGSRSPLYAPRDRAMYMEPAAFRPRQTAYLRRRRLGEYDFEGSSPPDPDWRGLTAFWASQIDIEHGYWATPWKGFYYKKCLDNLPFLVEVALAGLRLTVELESGVDQKKKPVQLKKEINGDKALANEIRYVNVRDEEVLKDLYVKLRNGEHTWPPYAINARGGTLDPPPHQLLPFAAFGLAEPLPPVLLVNSVREADQGISKHPIQLLSQMRTIELAGLDHWLSWAAKTDSVAKGRLNAVKSTPAIMKDIWAMYSVWFSSWQNNVWEADGGDKLVREFVTKASQWVREIPHSLAEHYFIWIALLRTVKVLQCIKEGTDTFDCSDVLSEDIIVYLA